MNKVYSDRYRESYVEQTLDNGLKVILWEKKDYLKSHFMLVTPFGGVGLKQLDEQGNVFEFHPGIAHFLEHKMFEDDQKDIMQLFSQLGANVNAFTSYQETAYYFNTSEEPYEALSLLLDFVQELKISEESVEKEKGIIIQELQMYQQMSDSRLLNETYASLFHHYPMRLDIGGDAESVSSITKKELENCYALNYHPSKMILIGVSGYDCEKLLEWIKKNQDAKSFPKVADVKTVFEDEPKEVVRKEHVFSMDVTSPKINIAYKLGGIADGLERLKKEWCIKLLLDCYFSSLNADYQRWMSEAIINDYYNYDIEINEHYGCMMFYCETEKVEEFKKVITATLQKALTNRINEKQLELLKRRYYGQSVRDLNNFDDISFTFMKNYFMQVDFFKSMDLILDITVEDIEKAIEYLDLGHSAIIEITPLREGH